MGPLVAAIWLGAALWQTQAGSQTAPAPVQTTGARAAASQTTSSPTQGPVLSVTTRMVQVNVLVHGRGGHPVTGLTRDDFEIYDSGVKQSIAAFAVESAIAPAGITPPALPPNVFSNMPVYHPSAPKAVTAILLDGLNTAPADQAYARLQLVKFLHTLTPDDRVALYVLGRQLRVLHDFTDDPAVLLNALQRHKSHLGPELAESTPDPADTGDSELDAFLDTANQALADFQTRNRVRTTLDAIQAIAEHLSSLPGRKNLVWISSGFPFAIGMDDMTIDSTADRQVFSEDFDEAARAVNSSGMAIYPVDARGLVGHPDYDAARPPSRNLRRPPQGPSRALQRIQDTHQTMEILAERTGGKAYYNTNDLKSAIRGAIDDAKVTYILGYYPSHATWDGKFHPIKVRVRKSGVEVRHRRGYFAFAEPQRTAVARKSSLAEAAWNPLDATGILFKVRLGPDTPRKGVLRLLMSIDPRQVTLRQEADRHVGNLDVLFLLQSAPGKAPTSVNQTLELRLAPATYETALQRGLIFLRDFKMQEAAYRLKVVVRDVPTDKTGSLTIRTSSLAPATPAPGGDSDKDTSPPAP